MESAIGNARGLVRTEASHKRVRVFFGGELIVDTDDALYVWESPYYPQYYVPLADSNTYSEPVDDNNANTPPSARCVADAATTIPKAFGVSLFTDKKTAEAVRAPQAALTPS